MAGPQMVVLGSTVIPYAYKFCGISCRMPLAYGFLFVKPQCTAELRDLHGHAGMLGL